MSKKKAQYKKSPKKSLGQNFLRDYAVIEDIVASADIYEGDVVIEVGPGEGVLTEALLDAGAKVYAVEIDQDLIGDLEEKFGDHERCEILNVDIRRFNIPAFLKEQKISQYKVVANLPYYITSSIIRLFLESETQPVDMTIMVQKEVAERICAVPGAMSILAVAVQYYGTPEYLFTVPSHAFYPVPKVDSAVLRIANITKKLSHAEEKHFFRVVKAGFSARRKKLAKNIANSLHVEKSTVETILEDASIGKDVRAQELSMDDWFVVVQKF